MADEETDKVTQDAGGVQGTEDEGPTLDQGGATSEITVESPEQPAPDAGEIEWAGGLIKKPPTPEN